MWSRSFVFFFNDTATTEIYTLSLHDALPISGTRTRRHGWWTLRLARPVPFAGGMALAATRVGRRTLVVGADRKSTRLNSSHANISYAVFCLKKKKSHRTPVSLDRPPTNLPDI